MAVPDDQNSFSGAFARLMATVRDPVQARCQKIANDKLREALLSPETDYLLLGEALWLGAWPDHPVDRNLPALHLAVEKGDHAAIDVLLEAGADILAADGEGRTAIDMAYETNDMISLRKLRVAGGACAEELFEDGTSAHDYARVFDSVLESVAARGTFEQAERALDLGARVNPPRWISSSDNLTALHFAVRAASPAMVRTLLSGGADPQEMRQGVTPLEMTFFTAPKDFDSPAVREIWDIFASEGLVPSGAKPLWEMSLDDLRANLPGMEAQNPALCYLAEHGRFDMIFSARGNPPCRELQAADFLIERKLQETQHAESAILILARKNQAAQVFTTDVWQGRMTSMLQVWHGIPKALRPPVEEAIHAVRRRAIDGLHARVPRLPWKKQGKG